MLTTKRLLLGLLALGIVGMHGLVTGGGTASHHEWSAASAAHAVAGHGHDRSNADASAPTETKAASTAAPTQDDDGGEGTTAAALCMALLLAFGVVALAGRRTTWVSALVRSRARISLPLPPVLRDSSPVPRFAVMRC